MGTLIVIPARLGASRLPRKPLRDLAGKPLIVRVLERVRQAAPNADVVVATDAPEVAQVVRAAGGVAEMTHSDHPSGTDRVAEVARMPAYRGFDVLVNVQGDEPFIPAEAIHAAAAMVERGQFAIGTVACAAPPSVLAEPSVVKVVCDREGRALYFSRSGIPFLREDTDAWMLEPLVRRHIGLYAYTRAALERWVALPVAPLEQVERLEQLRPLADGVAIGVAVLDSPPPPGVDTEDDLRRANASWSHYSHPTQAAGTR